MIYKKKVLNIKKKLTSDGDEEVSKEGTEEYNKVISRGSQGNRNLVNAIGRTQNRTFDVNKKVLDRMKRKTGVII